jgi:hypothetical protein
MAGAAGIRQVLLAHRRLRVGRRQRGVRRTMAALTGGNIGIAFGLGSAMDAGAVLFNFARVARRAKLGSGDSFGRVGGAVASDAGLRVVGIAESGVSARGHGFRRIGVARLARS